MPLVLLASRSFSIEPIEPVRDVPFLAEPLPAVTHKNVDGYVISRSTLHTHVNRETTDDR